MRSTISNPKIEALLQRIEAMPLGSVKLMEVCGTHTMAIAKSGIKRMLPENIQLISGPGCPVCVTPAAIMDEILKLSEDKSILLASYGDMIRVPGSVPGDNLIRRRARGARIEIVYSPMDALKLAQDHPESQVVFLGAGFETTAPGTAAAIAVAAEQNLSNFSVFSMLKRVEPALRALMGEGEFDVQGFLCPGHVATIIGERGFRFLPDEYAMPSVISGFEPEDILASVFRLLRQIESKKPLLENTYSRAVAPDGNPAAMAMMDRVFIPRRDLWRGLGEIPASGLGIREEFSRFDAQTRFGIRFPDREKPTACRCGEVIRGRIHPSACPLFGKACLPEDPVGPCMVSSEGACAAAYKYGEV